MPEDFVSVLQDPYYCTTNNVLLVDERRVLLESMNAEVGVAKSLAPVSTEAFERAETIRGVTTSFDSNFSGYYHQLVELLPRIAALNTQPYTDMDEVKLLCPEVVYPVARLVLERMSKLNLRPMHVEKGRVLRPEQYLFTPFKTRQFAGYVPASYVRAVHEAVLPQRPPSRRHRIFISREGSSKRQMLNQEDLLSALSRLGFQKFILEDLSAPEQIELFHDAEVVVGTHGAGLTNVLFSKRLKVLEIFPRDFIEPHYLFLCNSLGHTYRHLVNENCSRWDLDYLAVRARQRIDRSSSWNGYDAYSSARSINLSFSVDVPSVITSLAEMGVR
ncbi:MAG: glycosyltransferase family 61 protein [Rhodothermales bacterium]